MFRIAFEYGRESKGLASLNCIESAGSAIFVEPTERNHIQLLIHYQIDALVGFMIMIRRVCISSVCHLSRGETFGWEG
jgi:hypothetical protein